MEYDKATIKKLFRYLVRHVQAKSVVDHLVSDFIFDVDDCQRVLAEQTDWDMMRKLLTILLNKNVIQSFSSFLNALEKSGHEDVAEKITELRARAIVWYHDLSLNEHGQDGVDDTERHDVSRCRQGQDVADFRERQSVSHSGEGQGGVNDTERHNVSRCRQEQTVADCRERLSVSHSRRGQAGVYDIDRHDVSHREHGPGAGDRGRERHSSVGENRMSHPIVNAGRSVCGHPEDVTRDRNGHNDVLHCTSSRWCDMRNIIQLPGKAGHLYTRLHAQVWRLTFPHFTQVVNRCFSDTRDKDPETQTPQNFESFDLDD